MGQKLCTNNPDNDRFKSVDQFDMKICVIYTNPEKLKFVVSRLPSLPNHITCCRIEGIRHDSSSIRFIIKMKTGLNEPALRNLHSELIQFFEDVIYIELGRKYHKFDPVYIMESRARNSSGPELSPVRFPLRMTETV